MKLILPDRSEKIVCTGPVLLETLLLAEGINPLDVMASRGGVLIPEDTIICDDDEVRLIRISHGG